MLRLPKYNQNGFSLIEVLFAMAIFSIGILAVAKMELLTAKNNRSGNEITQATLLVESHMERLKNISDVTDLGDQNETNLDQFGNPGGIFTRSTRITNPLGGDFSRQIEITVAWNKLGRTRQVVLTTLTQGNGL